MTNSENKSEMIINVNKVDYRAYYIGLKKLSCIVYIREIPETQTH